MKFAYHTNTWGGVWGHPAGVTSIKDLFYLSNGSTDEAAADIAAESRFWAGVLGGEVHADERWHSVVVDGEWVVGVQAAPDHVPPDWPAGPQQQQVHLDLHVDDLEQARGLEARLRVADERLRFARDLHDDVAASMSGIRILSQVAHGQMPDKTSQLATLLDQINRSAQTTLESISDLIWAVKPHPDYLNDMADRMREYAGRALDAHGIDYQLHIPRDLPMPKFL